MLGYLPIGILLALATTLPPAWKWGLGVLRSGLFVALAGVCASVVVGLVGAAVALPAAVEIALVWLLTLILSACVLAYRFYRDPERVPPEREDVVVSPADGRVVYVRRAPDGTLPVTSKHGRDYTLHELTKTPLRSEDAVVIGISLSFLDVHVNRAPIAGRVAVRRHFPGLFGSLRRPEMAFENERATLVIERGDLQVAVVLIASRLVRRIVTFVSEGQELALGQRIGVIRFGSQVDVVLPARDDVRVAVRPGERVSAGESTIALLEGVSAGAEETPGAQPRAEATRVETHG